MLTVALEVPANLNPERVRIRTAGTKENPLFCLKDVCEVLGIGNSREIAARLDEDEKAVEKVDTPGGPQNLAFITESGLYSAIIRSNKPNAKPFRKWITGEVLPAIRKYGAYPPPAAPQDDDELTTQLVALLDTRRRVLALERSQAQVVARLDAIEAEQKEACKQLSFVERSGEPAPAKSLRARINELVRAFARKHGGGGVYQKTWDKLYRELYYRCQFDARSRARHSGQHKLDLVEQNGHLEDMYAIASEIFQF